VAALLDLLVKLTAFEVHPSPASKFMKLVMEGKDHGDGDGTSGDGKSGDGKSGDGMSGDYGKNGDDKSGDGKSGDGKSGSNGKSGVGMRGSEASAAAGAAGERVLSVSAAGAAAAANAAALADMLKLGPLLQTLLSLLGEPERGVDGLAVRVLQQVMGHNYEVANVYSSAGDGSDQLAAGCICALHFFFCH